MSAATMLGVALALDLLFGDPPNAFHPVAWLGRLTNALVRRAPETGALRQLVAGAAIVLLTIGAGLGALFVVEAALAATPTVAFWVEAAVLTCLFAIRGLGAAGRVVRDALAGGRLDDARHALSALCSRDAAALDESQLAAATIESLAENLSDSFVAPLLAFAFFGLPGAIVYRIVNTLDAMIGYRGRYEHLGKAAARLDDVLNLIPARLTAGLLLAAGALMNANAREGLRVLRRDRGVTASPNAGWPMAAMAGLLGVALEKPGYYRLGDATRPVSVDDIDRAWRIVAGAAALAALVALGIAYG
ncbi:MAG: cobalamin biosynthesis protein CobD [Myxococcales bacterium]|nr:cobalamin biosynthesis protein CobD [Myxococcales bacterium]